MSLTPEQIRFHIRSGKREIIFRTPEGEQEAATFPSGCTTLCFRKKYYNQNGQEITLPESMEVVKFYGSSGVNNDRYIVRLLNAEGRFAIAHTVDNQRRPVFSLGKYTFSSYDDKSDVVKSEVFEKAFLTRFNQKPTIFYGVVKSGCADNGGCTIIRSSCVDMPFPWESSFILNMSREEAMRTFVGSTELTESHPSCYFGNCLLRGELTVSPDNRTMFASAKLGDDTDKVRVATDFEFLEFARRRYSSQIMNYPCWYLV